MFRALIFGGMAFRGARQAAGLLDAARLSRQRLTALPAECSPASIADAHAIQDAMVRQVRRPGDLGGWKCGATNAAAQAALKLTAPFRGPFFKDMIAEAPTSGPFLLHLETVGVRGVETELGFTMARPLPARNAPYTEEEVAEAVGALVPCVEVVATRFASPPVPSPWLIADTGGCGLVIPVRSAAVPAWRTLDLKALRAELRVNGELRGQGSGAVVMGSPLTSLTWLANQLSVAGHGLAADALVITGTLTGNLPVKSGDKVDVEWLGLARLALLAV